MIEIYGLFPFLSDSDTEKGKKADGLDRGGSGHVCLQPASKAAGAKPAPVDLYGSYDVHYGGFFVPVVPDKNKGGAFVVRFKLRHPGCNRAYGGGAAVLYPQGEL